MRRKIMKGRIAVLIKKENNFVTHATLVIVTAMISFTISAVIFVGWRYFYPDSIRFDTGVVKPENIIKFNTVRNILKSEYYLKADENVLLEGAVAGMAKSLGDRYTSYFTADQWKSIQEDIDGSFIGIGVTITRETDGSMLVNKVNASSPAKKAGIKVGYRIIKIDGKDIREITDKGTVFDMIRGEKDSDVELTIINPDDKKTYNFILQREKVKVENIESRMLSDDIVYIKIDKFDSEIAEYFKDKIDLLKADGMKGLIIDVRDNPGGLYDQVVEIADSLLPKVMIVYTEDKYKHRDTEYSDEKELGLPLAVLVNGKSASASEILAGAIKDNKKGILIGTKTFGKGLVQKPTTLLDGSGINVTIARYFTPSGVCIHGKGIEPDIIVKPEKKYIDSAVSDIPEAEDVQLQKAIETIESNIPVKY